MNKIFNDDCLNILKQIPAETIDMVYLDPPFYTQRKHSLSSANGIRYEFSDVWPSRVQYIEYMEKRLLEIKRVLKSSGSIFLHCDTSASHYLRMLLDDIWGEKNFRSEIIWYYKRWSNSKQGLLPAHQTIFFYSKTDEYKFNRLYGDYSSTTNIDQILQMRERGAQGKTVYKRNSDGEIMAASEKKGVPLADVWEIPFLNPKAKERTGYPTQKPVELLERIIKISTDENDVILDPFCGSGTALVAAKLQNRKYIGVDVNPEAVELCRQRLVKPYKTQSKLLALGEDVYKTKSNMELNILQQFDCDIVQRNKGIDALTKKHYLSAPAAIKIQKKDETFGQAVNLLYNASLKRHCVFMILITYEYDWGKKYMVPDNMIVINNYESQMLQYINEKIHQLEQGIV
ncbi:MAG: site-specific DNA-methyltransferase [Peptococcaceae bacterium]|nr:site-specific DNA-methyltransferase [Peptococcaceae bacterium]